MAVQTAEIMVVTPHPDDAEFGIAGTVARWVSEGKSVVYVVCTSGEKGTGDPQVRPEQLAAIREQEQLAAARLLGVNEVVFLRYADQSLEDTPAFRKEIVRQIRIFRPLLVATTDPYRRYIWHRDHRITGQVVLDAVFPFARDHLSYPDLFEAGLQPHKVKEVLLWGTEEPNYRCDIGANFELKMAALRCHDSQVGDHKEIPGLWKLLKERAREMAEGESFQLGEAFRRVEIWW